MFVCAKNCTLPNIVTKCVEVHMIFAPAAACAVVFPFYLTCTQAKIQRSTDLLCTGTPNNIRGVRKKRVYTICRRFITREFGIFNSVEATQLYALEIEIPTYIITAHVDILYSSFLATRRSLCVLRIVYVFWCIQKVVNSQNTE